MDTSAAVSALTDAGTAAAAIGVAALAVYIGIRAWKMIRGAA